MPSRYTRLHEVVGCSMAVGLQDRLNSSEKVVFIKHRSKEFILLNLRCCGPSVLLAVLSLLQGKGNNVTR